VTLAALFAFLHHLAAFGMVAALTAEFVRQQVPVFDDRKRRRIRAIIHFELVGVTLIILCAVLMARGVGFIGGA
jgi:uncharacterized membrane protein